MVIAWWGVQLEHGGGMVIAWWGVQLEHGGGMVIAWWGVQLEHGGGYGYCMVGGTVSARCGAVHVTTCMYLCLCPTSSPQKQKADEWR